MFRYIILIIFFLAMSFVNAQDNKSYTEDEIKLHTSFLNAKIDLFKGDTTNAIKEFESLLKKNHMSMAAFQLSQIYYNKNRFGEAVKYGEKASNDLNMKEGYLQYMLGLYDKMDDDKKYQTTLMSLVDNYPNNKGYFYKLIDDYITNKSYKEALKLLEDREDEMGIREEIVKRKYDIYMSLGKKKKAEKELNSLIDKYPEELAYLYNLASFYGQTKQLSKSNKIYEKILVLNPDDNTAKTILQTTGSKSDVAASLQGLIPAAANPNSNVDDIIKKVLPYIVNLNKKNDESLSKTILMICSKLSITHPNNPKANTIYGDILYITGNLEGSKNQYIKTLEINKSVYSVWNQLFSSLNRLKDYDDLIKYTQQAYDYYPNQPASYIYHSIGQTMLGNYDKANEALEEVKFMLSTSDNFTKQLFKLAQVSIDIKSNKLANAKSTLMKFETNKENLSFEVLEFMSRLYIMMGDEQKAQEFQHLSQKAGNLFKK